MRRNIRLLISYDGTNYAGWQIQNGVPSIQGTLEDALSHLHEERVPLTGAGRTDSGVHAVGQVGNFYTGKDGIPPEKFRDAVNSRLPRDIRILASDEVSESFHARRSAISRSYEYRIIQGPAGPAHMARFTWLVKNLPSIRCLNDMAQVLCGTHDYTTFTAAGDLSKSRIRRIHHAVFLADGPQVLFRIKGNAFLWRMVRSILGTLLDVGLRGGGPQDIQDILDSRNRRSAGPTAPPRGLFLTKVEYGS